MSAPREAEAPQPFVLASASPSRRRLLEQAGLRPLILVSGIDEEAIEEALERIRLETAPERIALETIEVPAKKSDIAVDDVVLAWGPDEPREKMSAILARR